MVKEAVAEMRVEIARGEWKQNRNKGTARQRDIHRHDPAAGADPQDRLPGRAGQHILRLCSLFLQHVDDQR